MQQVTAIQEIEHLADRDHVDRDRPGEFVRGPLRFHPEERPEGGHQQRDADVQTLLPKFREMATEAGRDGASMPITIWGAKENLDLLKRDRDDGVSRLVVSLDSGKADTILPQLDRWATLIRQLGN